MILYLHDIIHDYNVKLCLHEKSPDPCESGDGCGRCRDDGATGWLVSRTLL